MVAACALLSGSARAAPAPAPDSRAGEYVAVQGGAETRSGETLLVEAYIVLWVILMGWIYLLWRKQAALAERLDDLERTIDRAAASADKKAKAAGS